VSTRKKRRRIIFTEDRKDHKDNSFNVQANAPEPPLHKRSAGSASDQEIGADCTAGYASKCLDRECELRNIPFVKELHVFPEYKGFVFEQPLRLDILIDEVLIVELKAVEKVLPIHKAQLLSYMRLLNKPLGRLINFHELVLRNGIYRMVLKGSDSL
jgi:GxxExxY protein